MLSSDAEAGFGVALKTMLWGGIFVGLGYFLRNQAIQLKHESQGGRRSCP